MKKGFTMIELIFVIVILGILASVAIPRLAGTRQDAEISATAADLRTLVSDAGAYYAVKNGFGTGDASIKWNELTNVPLELQKADGTATTTDGIIKIRNIECIRLRVQNRSGSIPAHILVAKDTKNKNSDVCRPILAAAPIKAYFDSRVEGVENLNDDRGAIPIGSSISIYETVAAVAGSRPGGGATAPIGSKPAVATPAAVASAVASAAGSRPGAQATAATGSKPAVQSTPAAVLAAVASGSKPAAQAVAPIKPATQKPAAQKPTAVASASQPEAPKPIKVTEIPAKPHIVHTILGIQTGKPQEVNAAVAAYREKQQAAATKEWIASGQRDKDMERHKEALKQIQAGGSATGSKPGGYFSTANGKGQVTQGTGTGSTGHALPAWFRR